MVLLREVNGGFTPVQKFSVVGKSLMVSPPDVSLRLQHHKHLREILRYHA